MIGKQIYKTKTVCKNCFDIAEQEIPFGMEVIEHILLKDCKVCGCKKTLAQLQPRLD